MGEGRSAMKYQRMQDGIFYSAKHGRVMEHQGYSTRIHWSADMLCYLRRHFATTYNEELAGCLGVSMRTLVRKARELGLEKDAAWLRAVWAERRKYAQVAAKRKGYPGAFKVGTRANPDGEFKPGHQLTPEQKERRRASLKKWYREHPGYARKRAIRTWQTIKNKRAHESN